MKLTCLTAILSVAWSAVGGAPAVLKDAFRKDFLIGAALNSSHFCETNSAEATLVKQQFNSISPEDVLKWESVHPAPGKFNFSLADRYVGFGVTNKMFIIGHNLIWHEQTPAWVFQDEAGNPASRDLLLARMREHIFTVVGRYQGKIRGWDVVNEALGSDGTLHPSPWLKIIGEDYVVKAYQFAHEADPQAELYYNDFGLEHAAKCAGAVVLLKKLQAQGVHIAAVGLQGHYNMIWPTEEDLTESIKAFSTLGVKVSITELDVDVLPSASNYTGADISLKFAARAELNPYPDGLPGAVQQQLAQRYADLFNIFMKHRHEIQRVTFWGVTDGGSWLNNWPIRGRTSYPLLFDRNGQPKPAFEAVIHTTHAKKLTYTESQTTTR